MPETVICAPVRTAVGHYGGMFKDMQAPSLGAAVISAVVEHAGVAPELIEPRDHVHRRRAATGGPVRARCLRQQ